MTQEAVPVVLMKAGEQADSVIHKTIEEIAKEITSVLHRGTLVTIEEVDAPSSKFSDNKNHRNLLVIIDKQLSS